MGLFFNTTPSPPSDQNNEAKPTPPPTQEPSKANVNEPKLTSPFLGLSTLDSSKLHLMGGISSQTLEYLSLDEGHNRSTAFGYIPSRSYSDDIMYGTGGVYLLGLGVGGLYGAREGLKASKGSPFKIRFNGLLNGCTRRGPFLGNSLGMIALGYTSINSLADYFGAPDNKATAIASGTLTGMLFKSTAGLKSSLIAGAICGSLVAVWKIANETYNNRSVDFSHKHLSA